MPFILKAQKQSRLFTSIVVPSQPEMLGNGIQTLAGFFGLVHSIVCAHVRETHLGVRPVCAICRQEIEGIRRKFLRLLNGVLGFHTKPVGICVTNHTAALSWSRQNLPDAIVVTFDRKVMLARLWETGGAADVISLTPAKKVFYIK